jgi:hypothetical protein
VRGRRIEDASPAGVTPRKETSMYIGIGTVVLIIIIVVVVLALRR